MKPSYCYMLHYATPSCFGLHYENTYIHIRLREKTHHNTLFTFTRSSRHRNFKCTDKKKIKIKMSVFITKVKQECLPFFL